ncbi:hypothetical protein FisN_3Lh025 [Fistulifera solaris]|uniref:Enoyl reductase (ER) domain-containing protein n=1 Tax=Fistulifera solaris TaxID=1519565 RepID=A0A1Z5JYJ3_FISSO|nr:hypothetical protein FisN_3Lh025 [Fistulifera solaris]|eukprot:GAX19090.1 hypothetical protein FisN_3Lh025 [Fistulifera solaris]
MLSRQNHYTLRNKEGRNYGEENYSSFDRSSSYDGRDNVKHRRVSIQSSSSRYRYRARADSETTYSSSSSSSVSSSSEEEEDDDDDDDDDVDSLSSVEFGEENVVDEDFANTHYCTNMMCDWGSFLCDLEQDLREQSQQQQDDGIIERKEETKSDEQRQDVRGVLSDDFVPEPEVLENVAPTQELSQPHDCTSVFCDWSSFFGNLDGEREDTIAANHDVIVAVEATAFTSFDDSFSELSSSEKYGTNFVGVIRQCDAAIAEQYGLEVGTRVAAIAKWTMNSQLVSIPSDRLWPVPDQVDSSDVASLMSAYLPAFTALHHGRARPYCYSITCLTGRRLLITGGLTVESRALIRMAKLAGVEEIFVHGKGEMKDQQVHMLDDWGWVVEGSIDIVVDYCFPNKFKALRKALAKHGRLVCVSKPQDEAQGISSMVEQLQISKMKRATLLDFAEHVRVNGDQVRADMMYLWEMLSSRYIRPKIDRYVTLEELSSMSSEALKKPLTGAVVCELASRHIRNEPPGKMHSEKERDYV